GRPRRNGRICWSSGSLPRRRRWFPWSARAIRWPVSSTRTGGPTRGTRRGPLSSRCPSRILMADADDVRRLALALPYVEEIDCDGFDFRVGGKGFVWSYPERQPGQGRGLRPANAVFVG